MESQAIVEYFRCGPDAVNFQVADCSSVDPGYFRMGSQTVCYGRPAVGFTSHTPVGQLYDVFPDVQGVSGGVRLPFDPTEVADNLRYERYVGPVSNGELGGTSRFIRDCYYLVRPMLPVAVRKYPQKLHLRGWQEKQFPRWPVDTTVDDLMAQLLAIAMKESGQTTVPFIWFWPEGASGAAIMTHDVESEAGVQHTGRLMDINDSFSIPASFQVIPEQRYPVTGHWLKRVRDRGYEVNVHDLNHDGHLYRERREFERRVAKINQYGRDYGASGFRAAVLYRKQEWFHMLEFDYDSSVPNVAHLDPQHGGCCTVMPYFIGNLVELPVTATQDYSLFHILNDYSSALWKRQMELILQRHGLINVIVHPDYISGEREEQAYKELLSTLARMRGEQNVWIALPREVSQWWRQRSQMRLVSENGGWRIEGPGSERAVLGFARLENDVLTYDVSSSSTSTRPPQTHGMPTNH